MRTQEAEDKQQPLGESQEAAAADQEKMSRNDVRKRNICEEQVFKKCDEIEDAALHIVDLFEDAHKEEGGKRANQTEIINSCFSKDKQNVPNLKNPYFNMCRNKCSSTKHEHGSLRCVFRFVLEIQKLSLGLSLALYFLLFWGCALYDV